ncbi:hypothetical protein P3L10_014101 [Capsicum annuum]
MDKYIYNYLVTKGLHETAEIFAIEANVVNPRNVAIESPEGYLMEWWDGFYDIYNTYQAEKVQRFYAKDTWTTENVGYHIPSDVPTSSPNTLTPVRDISHAEPAFHLMTPEDELSQPMEQIPTMPQQSEGKDEGEVEVDDINFKRTVQMEPNPHPLKKIKLMVSEPSEAGSLYWFQILSGYVLESFVFDLDNTC